MHYSGENGICLPPAWHEVITAKMETTMVIRNVTITMTMTVFIVLIVDVRQGEGEGEGKGSQNKIGQIWSQRD